MLSPEVKNAIILIIAVSIALKLIAPTLVGESVTPLETQAYQHKPATRELVDSSYSGHLGQRGIGYDNPFPGLFPESFAEDRQYALYPERGIDLQLCGLCTCYVGPDYSSKKQLNRYSGTESDKECALECDANGMQYVGFEESTQVSCGYISTR